MANTFNSVTSGSIGTTLTNVYTCPGSTTTIILGASLANTSTSPIGGSIKLAKNGSGASADDVLASDAPNIIVVVEPGQV
jgi:hexokinase